MFHCYEFDGYFVTTDEELSGYISKHPIDELEAYLIEEGAMPVVDPEFRLDTDPLNWNI